MFWWRAQECCAPYGLASRKSFTIGTMTGMRCISVTWVVLGKMANRDAERGFMSPWISPPFRRNISATCSSRTPSASPWMKNIGAEVVPFRSRGEDPLDEIRKVVRSRAQLLVLGFDGRAFEGVRREFRERVARFLDHAVTAEPGRNDDHLSHFVRMADRTLHCHGAAHAVTDEVRAWDLEVIEQRRHIVGEVFVGDVAWDVRRAPMALQFDGNHFPRFGELADPPSPIVGDGHECAVEQHHGIAASVDFVVHFEPVDRRVASRWFLLR